MVTRSSATVHPSDEQVTPLHQQVTPLHQPAPPAAAYTAPARAARSRISRRIGRPPRPDQPAGASAGPGSAREGAGAGEEGGTWWPSRSERKAAVGRRAARSKPMPYPSGTAGRPGPRSRCCRWPRARTGTRRSRRSLASSDETPASQRRERVGDSRCCGCCGSGSAAAAPGAARTRRPASRTWAGTPTPIVSARASSSTPGRRPGGQARRRTPEPRPRRGSRRRWPGSPTNQPGRPRVRSRDRAVHRRRRDGHVLVALAERLAEATTTTLTSSTPAAPPGRGRAG